MQVYLDGKEIANVARADTDKGVVTVYDCDVDGRFKLDHASGQIVTKELRGDVRVVMPERTKAYAKR